MTTHPTRHRIKFSELVLGQRFYDPISAEYFVKQSDSMAAMVTGLGDGTVPDEFEADDIVGVDEQRTRHQDLPDADPRLPTR